MSNNVGVKIHTYKLLTVSPPQMLLWVYNRAGNEEREIDRGEAGERGK